MLQLEYICITKRVAIMATENLSEKVSVNINASTLSSIDLLIDNGYYSNRSDFINQALRSALGEQQSTIDRLIAQNTSAIPDGDRWFIGVFRLSRKELEYASQSNKRFSVKGYGVLIIDHSCPDEIVLSAIDQIEVRGTVSCSKAVKEHYGLK